MIASGPVGETPAPHLVGGFGSGDADMGGFRRDDGAEISLVVLYTALALGANGQAPMSPPCAIGDMKKLALHETPGRVARMWAA
jgi:hypothetical protein